MISPCYNKGAGCPNRTIGCHSKCEAYLAWKAECDSRAEEERRAKFGADYAMEAIFKRRAFLKHTENGRRALSQR